MALNPLKLDPTRTTMLRQAFVADMHRRMMAIRAAVLRLVDMDDAFGLRRAARAGSAKHTTTGLDLALTRNTRWQFESDDKKIQAYQEWLKGEVDKNLLTVDPANRAQPWVQPYIGKAYKQGMSRAYADVAAKAGDKSLDFVEGGKEAFLKMSFEGPVGQTKLRVLGTRAFSQLKGISADMDKQMTTVLATGLAAGKGADKVARELAAVVDGMDITRARTIARTEIVHAHNEGQLDSFEAMNVEDVGVMAEWSTAHDGKVCPLCAPLEGVVLTVAEARGKLPRHPNCRCAWIPANVGEEDGGTTETTWAGDEQGLEAPGTEPTGKTTGQTWGKGSTEDRIRDSIQAEHPKLDPTEARKASRWTGADLKITGKLKPGSAEHKEKEAADKVARQAASTAAKQAQADAAAKAAQQKSDEIKARLAAEAQAKADAKAEAARLAAASAASRAARLAASNETHMVGSTVTQWETVQKKGAGLSALDAADYSKVPGWEPQPGTQHRYGVVVFDDKGRVLMPDTGFIGRTSNGKPGTAAALQAKTSTGEQAAIHDMIPREFDDTTSRTNWFLGRATTDTGTTKATWMTKEEALAKSDLHPGQLARTRDRKVIEAAFDAMASTTRDRTVINKVVSDGVANIKAAKAAATQAQASAAATARQAAYTPPGAPMAHPVLPLRERMVVGKATVSAAYAAEMDATIATFPEPLLAAMDKKGYTFQTGQLSTDTDHSLRGVQPRGWGAGKTMEMASGFFDGSKKRIVSAEGQLDMWSKKWTKARPAAYVVTHEFGHGVDHFLGNVSYTDTQLNKHYSDELATFKTKGSISEQASLSYFMQPNGAGLDEVFAHAAVVRWHPTIDPDKVPLLKKWFPQSLARITAIVDIAIAAQGVTP